jgi:denticleless
MRGNVTQLDLSHLTEDTIKQINGVQHRAPIKCIKWQPGQSQVFATAGQDGSVMFTDLRCSNTLIATLNGCHQLYNANAKGRSTMTGLVFDPLRSELFYTSGTPDTCVRLWDMRKVPSMNVRTRRSKNNSSSALIEEFSTLNRKHRSSVALTIDSIGSRLFLATSNDRYIHELCKTFFTFNLFSIFEFLTSNCDIGPVASYTASGFNSRSFFSNLSLDPSDKYILSGSSNGQAYVWDTVSSCNNAAVYELPVCAQLEVSKTAWISGSNGSLGSQIACISDDLSFSLFNWDIRDHFLETSTIKRPIEVCSGGKEQIYSGDCERVQSTASSVNGSCSTQTSLPVTPVRKRPFTNAFVSTPPSANKSILDFFNPSPRQLFK